MSCNKKFLSLTLIKDTLDFNTIFQNFQCCNCDFDFNPWINMLLSKFQRKTKKGGKGKGKRKSIVFTNLLWLLNTMIHLKKNPWFINAHVLHLPIYYISHLFNHFTTTIYLPILLQQFLLVLLYLLSMYRLTIYSFIILQLYL